MKTKKRALALLLSVLMLCQFLPPLPGIAAESTHQTTVPDGYVGIYTAKELDAVRNDLDGNYILMNDIVFAEDDFSVDGDFYNGIQCWSPIGPDETTPFTGTFDGNGYVVKGLIVNSVGTDTMYAGLFGRNSGTIRNLGVADSRILADAPVAYAGAIAGCNSGTIECCYNNGSTVAAETPESAATLAFAGGVAGLNDQTVIRCYNTGAVSAYAEPLDTTFSRALAGGIVGSLASGNIADCYNIGKVYADWDYTTGGGIFVGGIAGGSVKPDSDYFGRPSSTTGNGAVERCYNAGKVDAGHTRYGINVVASSYVGGIIGQKTTHSSIEHCYYYDNVNQGAGGETDPTVPCTDEQLRGQATFVGFDFDTVWEINENASYPYPTLRTLSYADDREENTTDFAGGTGTVYNPYLISDKTHLDNVRNHLDACFKMIADVAFSEADFAENGAFCNNGQGWEPIGTETAAFTGDFNGDGHVIKGLVTNLSGSNVLYAGLFGYNDGVIRNVGLTDGSITISSQKAVYAGGIAGFSKGSRIHNCYNTNDITAVSSASLGYAGGIVGYGVVGQISDCYNTGKVTLSAYANFANAGGIVGRGGYPGLTVRHCYNTGDVTSSVETFTDNGNIDVNNSAGGIVAELRDGTISDCHNTGCITTTVSPVSCYTGGIAGKNTDTVTNCYNTGAINAASGQAGGLAGNNYGTMAYCFNTGDVTVTASDEASAWVGGLAGYCYGSIGNSYNTGNVSISLAAVKKAAEVGGLVGRLSGTVSNGYNLGSVSAVAEGAYVGGIAGTSSGNDLHCYYLNSAAQSVGNGDSYAISCTAEQMKKQKTFTGYDFETVWVVDGFCEYPYPQLINNRQIEILSIEIAEDGGPYQTIEGLLPENPDGTTLEIVYSSGKKTVPATLAMLAEWDIDTVGIQHIRLTYGGCYTEKTITVEVTAKQLTSITLSSLPNQTEILEGTALDTSDGMLLLGFNNGTTEEIDITPAMVTGFDNTALGTQTLTVTYEGFTVTYEVKVIAKTLTDITVTPPTKTQYTEGTPFVPDGMTVTAQYNNGTGEAVTGYTVSGYNPDTLGLQTLTVTYKGVTATFTVQVIAKVFEGITVTPPTKTQYTEGTPFVPDGMTVTAQYNNGTSEAVTGYTVSGYDPDKVGKQTLTVTYEGKTATFEVEVIAKALTGITVTPPTKTQYLEGDPFSRVGMRVTAQYNNGTEETVASKEYTVSGYDSDKVGKQTVTITHGGFTDTFEVEVTARSIASITLKKPQKTVYLVGESLELNGGEITVHYNNKTTETVPLTADRIRGYNADKVGKQALTVTYESFTATFTVEVKSRVPNKITAATYAVSNGYISKIAVGTTVQTLLKDIPERAHCKIYQNGKEITGNTVIATGAIIKLLDGDTVKDSLTVIVTGDINGDGAVSITDMLAIKSHLLKKTTLSGAAAKAADVNGDNAVTITDFIRIKAYLLGKSSL